MTKEEFIAQGYELEFGVWWPPNMKDPASRHQAMYLGENGEHQATGFGGPEKQGVRYHFREFITLLFSHNKCSQPFEWNPNAELMLEEYFRLGGIWTMYAGHGSCVHGDTKILDLETGIEASIEQFFEMGTGPTVMTMNGPEKADPPFRMGREELFEVCLSDGSRFQCTKGHQLLGPEGRYVSVSSLSVNDRISGYSPTTWQVQDVHVLSITSVGEHDYYDLTVPGAGHYFAEGAVHHNSSKTRCSACFKTADYLMDPENTSCLFTSTTMPDGKRRVWADVERFWFDACTYFGGEDKMPGELVHSIAIIRYIDRGTGRIDEARGLALIPSGNDEEAKAGIGKMIGYKAPRMRIGLDEASHVAWKVVECIESNLMTGCKDTPNGKDMKVTVTLNPNVKTDTGGKLCCPVDENGKEDWKAKDTTTESRWPNKRGITIRLSGYDSPNVKLAREGKCAPHDQPWSGLLSYQLYYDQKDRLSHSSFQRQYDAIWPEGEAIETIFTDDEIRHHGGHRRVQQRLSVEGKPKGFDPSWTHDGDGAPIVFTDLIRDSTGLLVLEFSHWERMDEGLDPTKDFVLQLEAKVAKRLNELKVPGKDFGCDTTGGGRSVYSHILEKWYGAGSLGCTFNSEATTKPVSALDPTPANEKYTDLMTEMWMFLKELLMSGQLKNVPELVIEQLCARRYGDNNGRDKKGRITLEENKRVKKRLGKGTDEANALAIAAHVAKMHYGLIPTSKPAPAPPPAPKNPIMEMFKFDSLIAKAPPGSFRAKMRRFGSLLSGPPRID